jgi:hypothetical membrane protein
LGVYDEKQAADALVQGGVGIAAGIILFSALFLPWLSTEYSALSGLARAENQAAIATPLTLILLGVLTIFVGAVHILGYKVGVQICTVASALAFFISVMVIVVTLVGVESLEGEPLRFTIGPWLGAAGAIFGAVSSKLERR